MEKKTIIAIVLGILVIIAVVQTFQLSGLRDKLSGDGVTTKTATASVPVAAGGGAGGGAKLPSSIENLPTMVGGC